MSSETAWHNPRVRIICLYGVHAVAWVAFRVLWWCRVWIVKHCGRATLVTRRGLRCLDYDKGHWLTPAELAREMRK